MTTIAQVSFFVELLPRCLGKEEFHREAQGSVVYNKILIGNIIATSKTQGFLSCAHKCLAYPSCKSYNYRTTSEEYDICDINSDEGNVEEHFYNQPGSLFGRMMKIQVSGSSCRLLLKRMAILYTLLLRHVTLIKTGKGWFSLVTESES